MHSAKILAETEMNQHSGKILATITTKSACARCWSELGRKKVDLHHEDSFPLTYLSKKGNFTT